MVERLTFGPPDVNNKRRIMFKLVFYQYKAFRTNETAGLLRALENFYHQEVMALELEQDELDSERPGKVKESGRNRLSASSPSTNRLMSFQGPGGAYGI